MTAVIPTIIAARMILTCDIRSRPFNPASQPRHTFAYFASQWEPASCWDHLNRGQPMSAAVSMLAAIDRLCGQFATAMHNSELQIYATLVLLLVLGVMLFPPKKDPDQV